MKALLRMCASVVLIACAACGGSSPAPGTLELTISGLPAGANANVTVTGPSFSQALTATQTFTGLAPGRYAVIVRSVTVPPNRYFGIVTGCTLTGSPSIGAASIIISSSVTSSSTVTYAVLPHG